MDTDLQVPSPRPIFTGAGLRQQIDPSNYTLLTGKLGYMDFAKAVSNGKYFYRFTNVTCSVCGTKYVTKKREYTKTKPVLRWDIVDVCEICEDVADSTD